MKFIDFVDSATLYETFVFLPQNQGLSGLDPQKPKNPWETIIVLPMTKIHNFPQNSWNFCKMMPKSAFGGFCWFPGRHMLKTMSFL